MPAYVRMPSVALTVMALLAALAVAAPAAAQVPPPLLPPPPPGGGFGLFACSSAAVFGGLGSCDANRPRVSISILPGAPRAGSPASLAASSRGRGVAYGWDLDNDGSFDDATGSVVAHAFATAGTAVVRVQATDEDGRVSGALRSVEVQAGNRRPAASIVAPGTARTGQELSVSAFASDPDGLIGEVELDLDGDGAFEVTRSNGGAAAVTFASAGMRTIRARATDDAGSSAVATATIEVHDANIDPFVSASLLPAAPRPGATSLLLALATDVDGAIARYEFDLDGDGSYELDRGTSPSATVSFAEPGAHVVGIRVTDDAGGVATARSAVTVKDGDDPPSLSLSAVSASGAPTFAAEAADEDGRIVEYAWDLDGDGVFDDLVGPMEILAQLPATLPGTYEIGVRVTDDAGNVTTRRRAVTIRDVPAMTPRIRIFPPQPRAGDQVIFMAASPASSVPGAPDEWDLDGDGAFDDSSGAIVSFRFASPGAFTVAVRATAGNGSSAVGTAIVNVSPAAGNLVPGADFASSPSLPRTGATVTFSDTSLDADEPPAAARSAIVGGRAWDLDGDGEFDDATSSDPSTTFPAPGVYQVALQVTDGQGAVAVQRRAIDVHDGNLPPRASLTASPSEVLTGADVSLFASADGIDDAISEYAWDLDGDGAFDDLVDSFSSFTTTRLPTSGPHRVRLRVTDEGGLTDVATALVEARAPGPNRPPRVSISTFGGARVGVGASLLSLATDPDGDQLSTQWDLDDDGAFDDSTGSSAEKTFDSPGDKTIRVRVSDDRGGAGESLTTLRVRTENAPPLIDSFTVEQARVGRPTRLLAFVTDPDGSFFMPPALTWDLDGDGEFDDMAGGGGFFFLPSTWTPESTAPVTIGVRATDSDGATATRTLEVTPSDANLPPTVSLLSFLGDAAPAAGAQLSLHAFALDPDGPSSFPLGDPAIDLAWDLDADGSFDDAFGLSASLPVPTRGDYTVAVRATDGDGAASSDSQTFHVGSRQPFADFTVSDPAPGQDASITLTSTASDPDGTIAARSWDLDDDGAFDDAAGAVATVAFPQAGIHRVGHKVRDADGDNAIDYKLVEVRSTSSPVASLTTAPASPLVGATVTFTSTSTDPQGAGDIAEQAWDLDGDGAFDDATGPTASRSYDSAGPKTVGLRVTDQAGHRDEVRETFLVGVNGSPTASFSRTPLTGTVGVQMTFTSTSTDPDGTISSQEWDLDNDGAFDDASGASATRTYDAAGVRTVRLRVTDDDGAGATAAQSFDVVSGDPIARFAVTPASPRAQQLVTFSSTSVDPDGVVASQAWDLDDDGAFDDATTPTATRTFADAGDYRISLRVSDGDARTATTAQTVRVRPDNLSPRVLLTASRPAPRIGQLVTLAAAASDPDGDAIAQYAFDLDGDGDFEGGSDVVGAAAAATASFAAAGEVVVRVRATDARGASAIDAVTLDVRAGNQLPVVYAGADSGRRRRSAGGEGATFTLAGSAWDPDDSFLDSSTGIYDDGIALWEWDVNGDGDYADQTDRSGPDLQTIQATLGAGLTGVQSHAVSLRVTDDAGASSVHALTVETYDGNGAPAAFVYHWPFGAQRNVPVNFVASGLDPDGDVVTFTWDLDGDGAFDDATGPAATRTFASRGRQTVTVRASDDAAPPAHADVEYSFDVTGARPAVTIGSDPFAPETGQPVTLAADATDPDGTIASYAWDLDGDYGYDDATTRTVTRTFAQGVHAIGVRVTDDDGDSTAARRQVVVHSPIQLPGGGDAGIGTPAPAVTNAAGDPLASSVVVDPATGTVTVSVGRGTISQQLGGCASLDLVFPIRGAARNVVAILRRSGLPDIRLAATAVRDGAGDPTGGWRVHIECLERAQMLVEYDLPNPGGGPDDKIGPVPVGSIELIDPQGVVYDRQRYDEEIAPAGATPTPEQQEAARAAAAIEDATVTLQRLAGAAWVTVNPDDPGISPNVNPQSTGSDGLYRWDVSAATYRVLVSKPGYTAVTSESAVIPPPKLDLHIALERNHAPVAGLEAVGSPTAGAAGSYRSTASVLNGMLVEQRWDLDGDGAFDDASGAEVSHTFATAGPKQVGLRVVDADGEAASAVRTISVAPAPAGGAGGGGGGGGPTAPPQLDVPRADDDAPRAPPRAVTPLTVRLTPGSVRLGAVLRSGLPVKITCSVACQAALTADVDGATAKRLKLGATRRVGGVTRALTAGKATTLQLKLSRKARSRAARLRALRLSLKLVVLGAQGQRTQVTRTVILKP